MASSTSGFLRTARRAAACLAAAVAVAGLPSLAGATSVAYIDGGEVWVSSLDGTQKARLSGGEGNWQDVAASDGGRIAAVRREPSQISQTSTFRVWEANGAIAYNGALSEVSGYQSYAYPLSFDISADGIFLVYGFSASNVFPSAAFTAGFYARSVDNAALPPIEVSNATYPSFVGSRVVAAFGSEVRLQDPAAVPFGTTFNFWINTGGTGLQLRRTDVAATGTLVAAELWTDTPAPTERIAVLSPSGLGGALTGAVDCYVPAVGPATDASISQDATRLAWKDAQGVKVATAQTGPAEFCAPPSPPVIISATGTSPSIGGADIAGSLPPPPPPPSLSLTVPAKLGVRQLAGARGVSFVVSVSRAGRVTCIATVPARRLGLWGTKPGVVARCAATATQAGAVTLKLRLNALGRKVAKRLRGAKLTLKVTHGTKSITRVITLR